MKKWIGVMLAAMLLSLALAACVKQTEGKNDADSAATQQTGIEQSTTMTNGSKGTNEGSNTDLPGKDMIDDRDQAVTDFDYDRIMTDASVSPADMLAYIRENAAKLHTDQVANLVLKLEQLQIAGLPAMTDRYFETDQSDLLTDKIYDFDTGEIQIELLKNEDLRKMLEDAKLNGYKTETAEASFFPVIDYSIYENFSSMLPEDLSSYFSLMAVESGNKPASDGGLVISWDDVFGRAFAQEQFILKYGQSQKLNEVKELYGKYINFIFDGSNIPNSEHFAYNTKTLEPKLKESLIKASERNGNTPLEKTISEYLEVLKKNNYKLTNEVKQFRENAVAALSK
jgi:hypothetical protein